MSGRGLGHTGGTIDKLESIKGYQVERSRKSSFGKLKTFGISLIGQSEHLVKLINFFMPCVMSLQQ